HRTPSPSLFPYTTLFRSAHVLAGPRDRRRTIRARRHRTRARVGPGDGVAHAAPGVRAAVGVARGHGDRGGLAGHLRRGGREVKRSEEHTSELQSLAYLVC